MPTVTIESTKDATMRFENDGWSGYDLHLPVGHSSGSSTYRSCVYFPLSFTGWTGITSATLHLTGAVPGHITSIETRQMFVRRMTADWGEGNNNGEDNFASGQTWSWTNRSGSYTTTGQNTITITGGVDDEVVYDIDVTDIVQAWFSGSANYGFFLNAQSEVSSDPGLEFYSRNAASDLRPTLEIVYTGNVAPNAPVNLSPTGGELLNTLTPNLSGETSDPDPDDGISGYQIRLYEDNGTTLKWDSGTIGGHCVVVGSGGGAVTVCDTTFSESYSGPALTGNTFYKWKARIKDSGGLWGPYSALQRFKVNTAPNPPSIAISESPISALKTLTPTLNVTHSDNDAADNKMYGYQVQIKLQSDGSTHWDSGQIDTSGAPLTVKSFTYAGTALSWRTGYKWRARTRDSNLVWGNYSSYQNFSTLSTSVPVSLNPSASEVINGIIPTFSGFRGNVADTIASYQIILYQSNGTTQVWDSGTLTSGIDGGQSFSKIYSGTALSYNTTYQWKVRVTGSIGGTSSYSALQTFKTIASAGTLSLGLPTPNNLPTNSNVSSLTPTLNGSQASTFTDYQVEVYPESSTSSALGTPIWAPSAFTQSAATSFTKVYAGTALQWGTTYKYRARVGSPSLGAWSGLFAFTTDVASIPTLTAPTDGLWITTLTPTLSGNTGGGENATAYQIIVYEADGSTVHWDSGMVSQASATSFSRVYDGTALVGGRDYIWKARYTSSAGPVGPYSATSSFHVNAIPSIPTRLYPTPGLVFGDTLFPTFEAYFNDEDKASRGDYPTEWHVEIRNNDTDALIQEKTLTADLSSGLNTYVWGTNTGGADTGLAYDQEYKWRTWFVDSKSAVGAKSSYQIFSSGVAPTVSITTPSNGSNINTTRPVVSWSFSGSGGRTQQSYRLRVIRVSTDVVIYDSGSVISDADSMTLPAGYLQNNGEDYTFKLTARDTGGIWSDADESTVTLALDAPPAVTGLSATVFEEQSKIRLDWDASSLGSTFVTYVIYRRRVGDDSWGMIGLAKPETKVFFNDWYAGQQTVYEYRVTVVKLINDEPDLESPDSDIVQVRLESDVWFVIGQDRDHIFELPVESESHTRPVQQEAFEPLGTNRKAVVRGFVLGHEGTLDLQWLPEEKAQADSGMSYILYGAGPHILKNPFGDVYDVTFGSQDGEYGTGGRKGMTLTWIEIGQKTNNPLLTPDEFLATIGAE